MVKNLPAMQETWVQSLGQEDPLEKGMATPAFLPGEFYRQRSLESYSSQGCGESDMTERLTLIADNVLNTPVQQSDSVIHLYIYIIDIYSFPL